MGMFLCTEHGLTFMQRCCQHVSDAIDASKFERTNIVIDGADAGILLCDVCLPNASEEIGTGSATEWSGVKVLVVCGDHAKAW